MNNDTVKGQLDQFIGAAKGQWGKLTDDDFLRIKGDMQSLKGLVQERYGVTREDAEKQVSEWEHAHPHHASDKRKM
jgi:uncharacterized protein YjbJ (UPF0337 family)